VSRPSRGDIFAFQKSMIGSAVLTVDGIGLNPRVRMQIISSRIPFPDTGDLTLIVHSQKVDRSFKKFASDV
jgi:hypothetical protein